MLCLQVLRTMDEVQKAAALNDLAARVIIPYIGMAVILVIIGIMVKVSGLPEIDPNVENTGEDE